MFYYIHTFHTSFTSDHLTHRPYIYFTFIIIYTHPHPNNPRHLTSPTHERTPILHLIYSHLITYQLTLLILSISFTSGHLTHRLYIYFTFIFTYTHPHPNNLRHLTSPPLNTHRSYISYKLTSSRINSLLLILSTHIIILYHTMLRTVSFISDAHLLTFHTFLPSYSITTNELLLLLPTDLTAHFRPFSISTNYLSYYFRHVLIIVSY